MCVCVSVGMWQKCCEEEPSNMCPLSEINNASSLDKSYINRDPD